MFSNRRPYYGLKLSISDLFREKVRYLKESNAQESMMEKPYLEDEYPKMHLKLPGFEYKPRGIHSLIGPIADSYPHPGLAMIDYGKAKCRWNTTNTGYCTTGPVIITMSANYFWHAEFKFVAVITEDTVGVELVQLPETKARAWDEQDYLVTFPEHANGRVTICGFASTHTLVSQVFETVVAGMPIGIHLIGGAMLPIEKGQNVPATLLKSVYGDKGDDCGCITLSSNCAPPCACKIIGFTTRYMNFNETQTLTVIEPEDGCTYSWRIESGGGWLSELLGTSTIYTAPSSNPGCDNSPVIKLSVDDIDCDTLSIVIGSNATDVAGREFHSCTARTELSTNCWARTFLCDGSTPSDPFIASWFWNTSGDCDSLCLAQYPKDDRTEELIAEGCCPPQLA